MAATAQRYTAVAIVLHWAIAAAILFQLPLGFWMHSQAEHGVVTDGVFRAFQLHKSVGLTVLALSLVRLGWRLANPPPPLPEHMPGWERFAAKATHWAFYGLMIGLPLSGWLYVSAGWSVHDDQPLAVTTRYFGLFVVPDLFGLSRASDALRAGAAESAFVAHWLLAYAAIGLAVLHVAAALKHHVFDKDETLAHMVPGLRAPFEREPRPKNPARLAVLGVGLGLAAVALVAALALAASFVTSPAAPQAQSSFEISNTAPQPDVSESSLAPADEGEPAAAPVWQVDPRASRIGFAFTYSDETDTTRFEGQFTRWRADIRFDPDNLDRSSVEVRIETASATDGVAMHDNTLPNADWFDDANHPTAIFRANDFRRRGGGYEARGELTIKGRSRNATLPFTLSITGARAVMDGRLAIDRHDFDIGEDTEADALISREVDVQIHVEAARAP